MFQTTNQARIMSYPYAPWCWYIYLHKWVILWQMLGFIFQHRGLHLGKGLHSSINLLESYRDVKKRHLEKRSIFPNVNIGPIYCTWAYCLLPGGWCNKTKDCDGSWSSLCGGFLKYGCSKPLVFPFKKNWISFVYPILGNLHLAKYRMWYVASRWHVGQRLARPCAAGYHLLRKTTTTIWLFNIATEHHRF